MTYIFTYWKQIIIALLIIIIFLSGYRLRAIQDNAKEAKAINIQSNKNNISSLEFEKIKADIDRVYDNVDFKVTYENSYNCVIPNDGLLILQQATK